MATQHYRSLRIYKKLEDPPAAFDKADVNSYIPFFDWANESPDLFTGLDRPAPQSKSQGLGIIVDVGTVEWSFDGVESPEAHVHGSSSSGDGYLWFPGVRESEIYFRAASAAVVRVFAW